MRQENAATDGTVALPPATRHGALAGGFAAEAPVRPPVRAAAFDRLRARIPAQLDERAGRIALGSIALAAFAVVVFASAGSSVLVPRSAATYPAWEAGPLHLLIAHAGLPKTAARVGYSVLLLAMTVAYGAALLAARSLSLRTTWAFVIATALIMLLGPPLGLNDVWNYLGYARLGAVHHLNPYQHVMFGESNDPIYAFATWRRYPSPYGPLFTAFSYPLAFLPIPVAYWIVKAAMIAAALAFIWTVDRCARLLGRDPRPVILLIAANPIYVFYELGGFHNDFLMLLPSMGAVALLLARRDRAAGAVLMVGVAVKMTVIVLLPFMLIAARPPERRLRLLAGCALATLPLVVIQLALFGSSLPNLGVQSQLITAFSIPNLTGLVLGLGGSTSGLIRLANIVVVLVILWGLRRDDWVAAAGWATVALICSVPWLMPWYVVWVLPLAGLAHSRRLRRTALVFTVFLVLTFVPENAAVMNAIGFNPMGSASDQAAMAYQHRLQGT